MKDQELNIDTAKTKDSVKKILVIGASGFVGKNLVKTLLAKGHLVRCMARNPKKIEDLASPGCEIVQGDISIPGSLESAISSTDAVYVSIQTLVPQHENTTGQGFMDIELKGLQNIISACRNHSVHRLIYVTALGVSPNSPSAWVRGRWQAEQLLLNSGLDVSILRPGMIVGIGGQGFNMMLGNAKRRLAIVIGSGNSKYRSIVIDDLCYYLAGILTDKRAYGQCYDVGSDDVFTMNHMIDLVAEILGKRHPAKLHIPKWLLSAAAPLIQRISKAPQGAIKGIMDSIGHDMVGNPAAIRNILPRPLLSFRQAVEKAIEKTA